MNPEKPSFCLVIQPEGNSVLNVMNFVSLASYASFNKSDNTRYEKE